MYQGNHHASRSRAALAVSVPSYEATDPGSILGVAAFPDSDVAYSKRAESRGSYSSAIKMPAAKFK